MTDEPLDWIAIRAAYEAREKKVIDIIVEYGVAQRVLYDRMRAEGWIRRSALRPSTRAGLIGRMYRLLERQIRRLETGMDDFGEKEVTILGTLTRNLEKLIELDVREEGRDGKASSRTDIETLRQKLAERIEKLRKS